MFRNLSSSEVENNFSHSEKPLITKTFTGQRKNEAVAAHVIAPVLPFAGQKFPRSFEGYLEFVLMLKTFIPYINATIYL